MLWVTHVLLQIEPDRLMHLLGRLTSENKLMAAVQHCADGASCFAAICATRAWICESVVATILPPVAAFRDVMKLEHWLWNSVASTTQPAAYQIMISSRTQGHKYISEADTGAVRLYLAPTCTGRASSDYGEAGVDAQPGDLGAGQADGPGAGTGDSAAALCSCRFALADAASAKTNTASMAVITNMVLLVLLQHLEAKECFALHLQNSSVSS